MLIQWALIKKDCGAVMMLARKLTNLQHRWKIQYYVSCLLKNMLPGGTTADVECSYVMHPIKQPPAVNDDSQRMHQAIHSDLSTRRPMLVAYECMPSSFGRGKRSWGKQIIGIGVLGPSEEKDQLVSATSPRIEQPLRVNLHRLVSSTVA